MADKLEAGLALAMLHMMASGFLPSSAPQQYSQCHKHGCWAWGKKGEPYDRTCAACAHHARAIVDEVRGRDLRTQPQEDSDGQ